MKRYKKKATTYDSMPWANSSFDRKHCRSTMRNYRLILDADDENWFKQRKAELVQKLKALKASLEKSKENPKVRRAIKAVGIMIAMISASALGFLVHKVISRKLGSDANKPVNELVNELTSNIQPVIEAANTNSVPQQTANLCKSSANDLSQFSKGVKEILDKYGKQSAYSSSDFMEEPLMKRIQPPSPPEPTISKTVNARKELSNTLRSASSDIGNAKSIIKRVSSDTLKKNPTLRSDLLGAINKLSTAERAVNTNVFESDFTKKHAEMSSRMVNEALNAVKSALNDFNGYETDKDEQAINTVLSHIQSASNKLKSVKVLDSKRVRLDSIRRYNDGILKTIADKIISKLKHFRDVLKSDKNSKKVKIVYTINEIISLIGKILALWSVGSSAAQMARYAKELKRNERLYQQQVQMLRDLQSSEGTLRTMQRTIGIRPGEHNIHGMSARELQTAVQQQRALSDLDIESASVLRNFAQQELPSTANIGEPVRISAMRPNLKFEAMIGVSGLITAFISALNRAMLNKYVKTDSLYRIGRRDAGVKGMKKGQHVKARDPEYVESLKNGGAPAQRQQLHRPSVLGRAAAIGGGLAGAVGLGLLAGKVGGRLGARMASKGAQMARQGVKAVNSGATQATKQVSAAPRNTVASVLSGGAKPTSSGKGLLSTHKTRKSSLVGSAPKQLSSKGTRRSKGTSYNQQARKQRSSLFKQKNFGRKMGNKNFRLSF